MKFFIAFVVLVAVASASPYNKPQGTFDADLSAIIAAIYHPSTDPVTADLLTQQLQSILSQHSEQDYPISVGPALVEHEVPAIVEEVLPVKPVAPAPSNSPLVQIIVNVNAAENPAPVKPEIVPTPVIVVDKPELEHENVIVSPVPTPVIVVDKPEGSPEPVIVSPIVVPTPVIVVDKPEASPEPVIVSPIVVPTPVIVVDKPEASPEPVIVSPIEVPTPVIVVDKPEAAPEPVLIAPIQPAPVMVLPEILN